MRNLLVIVLFVLSLSFSLKSSAQQSYDVVCIGFYNLENLFDTIYNPELRLNEEFTPEADKKWGSKRYHEKLNHMARVIAQVGTDVTPDGLALLGVSEIENRGVLEDLVKDPQIADRNYKIVHYDSPDRRGVDVGLLYQEKYFKPVNSTSVRLTMPEDTGFRTRDQLVVSGLLNGEMIHVVVNHWPSRSGGEKRSRPKRNAAGKLSRMIVDSLLTLDSNAKIMVMGDLNDDPVNPSVKEFLRASGSRKSLQDGDLYNPMYDLYRAGIGSLAYRDTWNLFDQIILSQGLLSEDRTQFSFYKAVVFNKNFLLQKEGSFAGYPFRTFVGDSYMGGYSDHFPVYVLLIRASK
ncbi:MAG: endonuclease/exonuclease/phosphatase family protein [Bacteroidales bacterium]|nr:endonuclease/exonuclease/phosphatase family protein [Bacteroidales bacterium]